MDIIKVKNLTKKFKDFIAVDNISFSVKQGEIFAFLGPNGAGKTTTIKMLTTLLHSTSGECIIAGKSSITDEAQVRKSFGIVFQDQSLDEELTACENMHFHAVLYKMPKASRVERIKKLMEFVELWDRRKDLVKNFSGGMKRRLEIARGLLHHPKVLFLDEPTLGLDPQTSNAIWKYVKNMRETEGTTVFFTTHYMAEAERVADRVAVIDRGKIVIQGTVPELFVATKTDNLEDAFLTLTGRKIREEKVSVAESFRQRYAARRRR